MAIKTKVLSKKHKLRAEVLLQKAREIHQAGYLQEAESLYLSLLKKYPNYPDALNLLGVIAHESGDNNLAITRYKKAISIMPSLSYAYNNMGFALQALGRLEEAITSYEKALAINPGFADAQNNLGNIYQELGRTKEAIICYEQTLKIRPNHVMAHHNLAMIRPTLEQIPEIEKQLINPAISETDAMHYHFAIGHILNDAGSYKDAFDHYLNGNSIKRKLITYDSQRQSAYVDELIKAYSKNHFQKNTICGSDSELPVFIIGMPRSGTTLVEQIISSHPQIYGAGELATLTNIEKNIGKKFELSSTYPASISLCDDYTLLKYSAEYLSELNKYSQDTKRITDKMPDNFLRTGLIKTLFPKARIIHCKRDAMDTCTSIFLNSFVNGNKYSFDLTEIGKYYLDYERLMAHWFELFPSEIFEVKYENLVFNQAEISRQLIEFIGLDWNEKCLEFYKNNRAIKTLSSAQVRQPIHKDSIQRWKHYEENLEPLLKILKQHI